MFSPFLVDYVTQVELSLLSSEVLFYIMSIGLGYLYYLKQVLLEMAGFKWKELISFLNDETHGMEWKDEEDLLFLPLEQAGLNLM